MNSSNTTTYNFPLATVLGIVFIVLRLTHVIAWSWLWVLAPFWIPLAFVAVVFCIGAVIGVVVAVRK